MKETLRKKLESHIEKLQKRSKLLKKHIEEYSHAGNWERAMHNDIKMRLIEFEINQLTELLK